MKLFITDLEAYNNGHLVGEWITLPMEQNELAEAIENILYKGRFECNHTDHHEEYFITDFECDYMDVEEYSDPFTLNSIAEELGQLDEYDLKKYTALRGHGYDHKYSISNYEDVDMYEESDLEDVAEHMVDEGLFGTIPDSLKNYIDYAAIARDLSYDGYTEIGDDVIRVA